MIIDHAFHSFIQLIQYGYKILLQSINRNTANKTNIIGETLFIRGDRKQPSRQ